MRPQNKPHVMRIREIVFYVAGTVVALTYGPELIAHIISM